MAFKRAFTESYGGFISAERKIRNFGMTSYELREADSGAADLSAAGPCTCSCSCACACTCSCSCASASGCNSKHHPDADD